MRRDDFSPWPLYHGCLNNPHWRAVLKAWVKRGIERGLDGFVINYFFHNGCMCRYCRRGFKEHLRRSYSPEDLLTQFGIDDLESYRFAEINGWYKPNEMTPLRLEAQAFADISRKEAFDDVFTEYGRSLKPDLILAQWLHSYQPMAHQDERMMLPPEMWARGEDYIWYCTGQKDATLQLRYIRGAGGDRPYTICRYEHVKIRAAMAELAANGGAPMALFADFNNPDSRRELVRFFAFMKRYDAIYHANRAAGEVVLLYPRSQLQQGRFTDALSAFHDIGNHLLDDHVLFDVIPDDIATSEKLRSYKRVFTISSAYEMEVYSGLSYWAKAPARAHNDHQLDQTAYSGLSRFEAPTTVRVSANRPEQGDEIDIHFVNYARNEPDEKSRKGFIADENPVPVSGIKADVVIPSGFRVTKVEIIIPEVDEPAALSIDQHAARVQFTVPEILVYGVARIYLERGEMARSDRQADASGAG